MVEGWDLEILDENSVVHHFTWLIAYDNSWILSTDASVNPTRASYSGLLRTSYGETVFAFAELMED